MAKKLLKAPSSSAASLPPAIGMIGPTPPDLIAAIHDRRSAVYVGAGLSMGAGFPGWAGLLAKLVDKALAVNAVTDDHAVELRGIISKSNGSDFLMAAQELSDRLGRSELVDAIADVYGDDSKLPTSDYELITRIPFDIAITTNYDRLLERSYVRPMYMPSVYTHTDAPNIVDALWKKKFFVLKAHGDVDHKKDLVLTEKDYRDIIYRSQGYQSALSAIFTTKTILFLGISLNDPETRLLLGYLHDAFHGSGSRHYALVPKKDFTQTLASRWRQDYKVELITYESTPGYPEIGAFLKTLLPPAAVP